MVVAVVAMRMMQVTIHEVVDVVTVRHGLVPALGAVLVRRLVSGAGVPRRAVGGVVPTDRDLVLVDVVAVRMVQVARVKVVDVAFVPNGRMTALGAVLVLVLVVLFANHGQASSSLACSSTP